MPSASLNFLITGAGRGIGRGLSRLLLERGHRVMLLDNNEIELRHTCTVLGAKLSSSADAAQRLTSMVCNLRNPADIKAAAQRADSHFAGRLDCLINNAAFTGAVGAAPFADLGLADWQTSVETNLTAPMLLSQACLPLLRRSSTRQQGGSIVMMSSTRAYQSEPNSEGYAATKAGLIGLMHAMAVSIADDGVRVNAILPGWINVADECKDADDKGSTWEDGLSAQDHRWHLTGRVGKVEDILKAVEYLVAADFVSGTEVVVDGGVTRKMVYPEE